MTDQGGPPDAAAEIDMEVPEPTSYPPYPPYAVEPVPPSVAEAIHAGRHIRRDHKSVMRKPVRALPKPARPRHPKATDVKMSKRASRAHARCLRRHNAVLTDRLEYMSKPRRRNIIYMWREHADILTADTIARLRSMLDADEPFKPDQAYEYFINLRKAKKRNAALRAKEVKKDVVSICANKRFAWARNATVAFAKGIQQRLAKPGRYTLADGMLRLSNIILNDMCSHMHVRTPSRSSQHPKAKFMMEMSDKVAIWIDEILAESDDRMLIMDYDEDEDVINADRDHGDDFADDFLNMMGGSGDAGKKRDPAYLKFKGDMLKVFIILTDSMENKGDAQLFSYGKCNQTYKEGADELKTTPDFHAEEFNSGLAKQLNGDLTKTVASVTPSNLAAPMKDMVNICSNYLAQYAEYNKDKGPAMRLLIKEMKTRGNKQLFHKEKSKKSYDQAARQLEDAKGLENDHDDPALTKDIHGNLSNVVANVTPSELKQDMEESLDIASKYLSQMAVDENDRGPAFDLIIKTLEHDGADPFFNKFPPVKTKFATAYVLRTAPGLSSTKPDPATAPQFDEALHKAVDIVTPKKLKSDMAESIPKCANYLSGFVRDREQVLALLMKQMKSTPSKELAKRNDYAMDYGTGAAQTEGKIITPYLPVKDIAEEMKGKLSKDVESQTPGDLKTAMKSCVTDVSKHLSQAVAVRSGAAGERYGRNLLGSVKKSIGTQQLYKHKSYGQSYSGAAEELKYAGGPVELTSKHGDLHMMIHTEIHHGVPKNVASSLAMDLRGEMDDAAKHLTKSGYEKSDTLEHLITGMKEEGNAQLGELQGYTQTYDDGAQRLSKALHLQPDKVDKKAYEKVKGKLTAVAEKKPNAETESHMPDMVEEAAKYLSAPIPETDKEKRKVLADLMLRKADDQVAKQGLYALTHEEAGHEIIKGPVGQKTSANPELQKHAHEKIAAVVPQANKKLQSMLKETVEEGSAHVSEITHGRGEAMQVIHDVMKKDGDKDFLKVGDYKKTHKDVAEMISKAETFGGKKPPRDLYETVVEKVDTLPKTGASPKAMQHMDDTSKIASAYVAGIVGADSSYKDAKRKLDASLEGAGRGGAESEEERRRRKEEEEAERRRREEEKERRRLEEEERRRMEEGGGGVGGAGKAGKGRQRVGRPGSGGLSSDEYDPERQAALEILHKELRAKGTEILYKQPHTELTHVEASDWLGMKPKRKVDKTVKESADTGRLHKKFERKLDTLVSNSTQPAMQDAMQDVVIESARILSEYFVANNYKALVSDALISEMQKKGNEILVEVDGPTETFFFAAQRLKKVKGKLESKEPCDRLSYIINKKLDEIVRCRSMARKLTCTMKEHIKHASDYLSEHVTKPDEQIEAYVALLGEMEAAGDAKLIEGDIPKSYKKSADFLRKLTSFDDQIELRNDALQSCTEAKLKKIMQNVPPRGYTQSDLSSVISSSSKLLVSYITLQVKKTEALKFLIERLDQAGQAALLRHGAIRKSYADGANILCGKNTDELVGVVNADPVVSRKIQIKLHSLLDGRTPQGIEPFMDDVIDDATAYLAVNLLQPRAIQVCKCMKNVCVQCELWCDEILRRVARPPCTCSRHVSAQALSELATPPPSRAPLPSRPGPDVSTTPCPSRSTAARGPCPAPCPKPGCSQHSYMLYSSTYLRRFGSPGMTPSESTAPSLPPERDPASVSTPSRDVTSYMVYSASYDRRQFDSNSHVAQPDSRLSSPERLQASRVVSGAGAGAGAGTTPLMSCGTSAANMKSCAHQPPRQLANLPAWSCPSPSNKAHSENNTHATKVSTEQMSDWHAMMVSLMWNVQAWRDWIQESIDRAYTYPTQSSITQAEGEESWSTFQRRIATEALQWRQYDVFSRQLTLRLALRYRNKQIVSPTRATNKTETYLACQQEMLDIVDMFSKWTLWLTAIVKESNSLTQAPQSGVALHELRWFHFKKKVSEYSEDWTKYNMHLKVCWEQKYRMLIAEWLPAWKQPGPVWVVSACGAVPSGAVAAGIYDSELIWVARTTHRCNVLPAALHPSKHCCIVYADGAVHHYTKYQVMCNAESKWMPWRARAVGAGAVRVAAGVHVGRVLYRGSHLLGAVHAPHYRCHVVIFGRPFAFNCYELLVLSGPE